MGKFFYFALFPAIYILITYLLHVFYFAGGFSNSKAVLHGKTVIVTGANTGIGKYTAFDLARRGARVILACRTAKRALPVVEEIKEKTKNSQVLFMELDLSSFDSIQRFSDNFLQNEQRLDILVNNAGMMLDAEAPVLTEDGIEMHLMVNHLGHMFLTQNLLELLKKSGPGSRVISVSDKGHEWANPTAFKNLNDLKVDGSADYVILERATSTPRSLDLNWHIWKPLLLQPACIRYFNSKLATTLFSKELSKRLAGSGVTTYALHPGAILTDIGVDRSSNQDTKGIWLMYAMAQLPDFIQPLTFAFKSLAEGAQTSICCAVNEELAAESGLFYADCVSDPVYREEMNDEFTARFWEWSESLIREARNKPSRAEM